MTTEMVEIPEEHVRAALKKDKGQSAVLSSWKIEGFTNEGDNYATTVTSTKVEYLLHGQANQVSYIVKANRTYSTNSDFSRMLHLKEIEFLGVIAPDLNIELTSIGKESLRLPKLLHSCSEAGHEMLFMEDLRPCGFRMLDRVKGLDIAHTNLILKELGRLHASSILLQAKSPGEDLLEKYPMLKYSWHNYSEKARDEFNIKFGFLLEGSLVKLRTFRGSSAAERWVEEHKGKPVEVFEEMFTRNSPFEVIIHGDCWNNNFLFRYSDDGMPAEVMLVDLQLNNKVSPAIDLTYLMFSSFKGDIRKQNTEAFLRVYYDSFCDVMRGGGVQIPYTYQQLLLEYQSKLEYGLLFSTLFANAIAGPVKSSETNIKGYEEFFRKWNEASLQKMSADQSLRDRFFAVYQEMTELGVFDSYSQT